MPRLSPLSSNKLLKILRKHGFILVRQVGSHAQLHHADGRKTTVPIHQGEDIGRGLLRKILKDTKLSVEDLSSS